MKALDYVKPSDIDEAYALLNTRKNAALIAGGLFLRLQKQTHPLLIDLDNLDLDYIKEVKDGFIVGAMTNLRDIETSLLPVAIKDAVKQISGIGVRNLATIGGSVCGRYPFSDIDTALCAFDAYLTFYKSGKISMRDFYQSGLKDKDILLEIIIKKPEKAMTRSYKKVYTDFSLVNVTYCDGDIAIGARPGRAIVISGIDDQSIEQILDQVDFKSDYRASGDYRKALAKALLEDILKGGQHGS